MRLSNGTYNEILALVKTRLDKFDYRLKNSDLWLETIDQVTAEVGNAVFNAVSAMNNDKPLAPDDSLGFVAKHSRQYHEYCILNNGEVFCHISEMDFDTFVKNFKQTIRIVEE